MAVTFPLALSKSIFYRSVFYIILIGFTLLSVGGSGFLPYWAAYFTMGILYALYISKKIFKTEFLIVFIITSVVVFFNQSFIDLIIAISALIIIHFFSDFKSKTGYFLGKISYSVYLLHSVVGSAFVNYMSHIYREPYQKFLVISGGVGITILIAFLYWRFIEKPSQNLAQRITLK